MYTNNVQKCKCMPLSRPARKEVDTVSPRSIDATAALQTESDNAGFPSDAIITL